MSPNTEAIVQEIRAEFESMLSYVQESTTATADQVERGLFKRLLALGARLLLCFFAVRSQAASRTSVETASGAVLPYHSERKRDYFSVFGKLPVWRPYFYMPTAGGLSPLDEELSLGADCYSDLLRELVEYLSVDVPYEKATAILARILGQSLSSQAVSLTLAADAAEVESYYAQKPAPTSDSEAAILVIQTDGKGIPMVRETPVEDKVRLGKGEKRSKKKEAIVTAVYTIVPYPRTVDDVIASFFHTQTASAEQKATAQHQVPSNKHLRATLDGKDTALERLASPVAARQGPHIEHCVALTDGCKALQVRVQRDFPDFTLVLDFIHADEYLWEVANSLYGEQDPTRLTWVETQAHALLSGYTAQVVDTFRTLTHEPERTKTQCSVLHKAADYFERNLPFMHYDQYLAYGWPIASGVIEGACRHFVKDRFELSGMRWTQPGAENLLRLRAVAENSDWDAYHQFRREQRHLHLYGQPLPQGASLEDQALAFPMPPDPPLPVKHLYLFPPKTALDQPDESLALAA